MKRFIPAVFALTGLVLVAPSTARSASPQAAQVNAWHDFVDTQGPAWTIRWSDRPGTPATIRNLSPHTKSVVPNHILTTGAAAARALEFLTSHPDILGIRAGVDEFVVTQTRQDPGGSYVRTEQRYLGIPVRGGGYTVTLRPEDGAVQMINGHFFNDITLDPKPAVTPLKAIKAARAAMGKKVELASVPTPALTVLTLDTGYRLAYLVTLRAQGDFRPWNIAIDARTGDLVYKLDGAVYADVPGAAQKRERLPGVDSGANTIQSTGTGNVLPTNLCGTISYGVSLNRLVAPDSILKGVYADVTPASGTRASSPSENFSYTYSDPFTYPPPAYDTGHFDEVNVYYHTDYWFNRFASYPFYWTHPQLPCFTQVPAGEPNWPNAAFVPASNSNPDELICGTGNYNVSQANGISGIYDPAKNSAILYHELTHALTYYLGLAIGDSTTAQLRENHGMTEGFGDYMACSQANDPGFAYCSMLNKQGGYQCRSTATRRLDTSPATFNRNNTSLSWQYCDGLIRYYGEEHVMGMIWGGALWDCRAGMGLDTNLSPNQWRMDIVAMKAADNMASFPDFDDGLDAVVNADWSNYPDYAHSAHGAHEYLIRTSFQARGIGSGCPPTPAPPAGMSASDQDPTACGVRVQWQDVANVEAYRVYRDGVQIGVDQYSPHIVGTLMTYIDGVSDGVVHTYSVRGYNSCAIDGPLATDTGRNAPAPPAPTGVATTGVSCGVTVSWNSVPAATSYNLYRNGQFVKNVASSPTTDTAAPLASSNFTVASVNCNGTSAQSAPPVPGQPTNVLLAPTGVSADDGVSETSISVRWNAVSGAAGYHVYRNPALPPPVPDIPAGQKLIYTDTSPPNGSVTYSVAAYACAAKLDGPLASDTGYKKLSVTIAGPTSLSSGQTGSWTITISGGVAPYTYAWQKYRDCPGGPIPAAAPASMGGTEALLPTCWQWEPFGANSNSASTSDNVDFRVKCTVTDAVLASGFSQRNVDIPGTTGSPQPAVTSVTATDGVNGINKVQVTWGPSDGAEGFRVTRAGTLIYTATQNQRTYTDPSAPAAISSYCVVAYSGPNASGSVCDNGYPYVALAGTVTGPSQLAYNGTGTYTVNMTSGGIPPLTRQWYHATYCGGGGPVPNTVESGGDVINVPPCNVDYPFGTGTTSVSWMGTYDVTLSCRVTDAVGRTTKPAEVVDVIGVTPNALAKGPGEALQATTTLPDRTELLAVGNPVRGRTDVDFTLAAPLHVSLTIFDIAGRRVESLADGDLPRGRHRVSWNAALHPAGMYLYRFTAGNMTTTRRFMVVR